VYERVECQAITEVDDARFEFFTTQVQYTSTSNNGTTSERLKNVFKSVALASLLHRATDLKTLTILDEVLEESHALVGSHGS
jgi:hypothetical protein